MSAADVPTDALHDALKKKLAQMKDQKHADGSLEDQEGGVTENKDDPDQDDSDHAPELDILDKTDGEEGRGTDPVSLKLQEKLNQANDDEGGAHGSSAMEKHHLDILRKVVGEHQAGPEQGKKKGLHEMAHDKMRAELDKHKA